MQRFTLTGLAALAAALVLAACGGAEESAYSGLSAPLFDDEGQPTAAAMVAPPEALLRTRAGLYASAAQLDWQQLVAAPSTVVLDLDSLGSPEAGLAQAEQLRGQRGSEGLAWFVRGGRGAQAVELADRLDASGIAPVFLVL